MKRFVVLLLLVSSTALFGQHFKLTRATVRSWTSQSNPDQRGAEYQITLHTSKKVKNLTIARAWVLDKCYVIESLIVNNKPISSSNQTIAKETSLKIYINVKEVRDNSGAWILNNNECNGVIPVKPQEGKITIEYDVNGIASSFTINEVERLAPIQFK